MPADKESDKGLMHSWFGGELCDGCKGLLVVAFVAPTQRDVSDFADCFSKIRKTLVQEGAELAKAAKASQDTEAARPSSFENVKKRRPSAKKRRP